MRFQVEVLKGALDSGHAVGNRCHEALQQSDEADFPSYFRVRLSTYSLVSVAWEAVMKRFCTQCGHQNGADSSFCEECGKPITSTGVTQEGPAPPVARGRWFKVTAAIVLLLAAGVFVVRVLVPSIPAPPAMAKLGIGHKPLEQAVVGKWSEEGHPDSGFEFFPDKTFSLANKEMPLNGTWVVLGERRIKADVTFLGTVLILFDDVEISGDRMSGSMTVGNKKSGRFSVVRVK